ncbi:hypothetical protein [Hoyosella subflava]|uniref:Uncharacterized protein n=1 Tax=Hoyosella subflava (strain DSM 45089 / JCM 17490 / NBRC 109087 / DQS3-9A1) TaxID=443218 RepID=F6ELC5_HOYSD|nr:hypothetical protein [Hoyosella subflava]AEF39217.1 hypothetical protein AS9A_0763 [Hoyosella subflava DQS3-9A1]
MIGRLGPGMNVLIEMTALSISRSASCADSNELAAWFEAKARLHEHLAVESAADRARESALALEAHEHSLRLLRGRGTA